jgi:hypothetical protein
MTMIPDLFLLVKTQFLSVDKLTKGDDAHSSRVRDSLTLSQALRYLQKGLIPRMGLLAQDMWPALCAEFV